MSSQKPTQQSVEVHAHNIGGIDETTVSFSPGVTILAGQNATNKTSLLRSIMAALGSSNVSLKGDAEEGSVDLTVDGQTYSRSLTRPNGQLVTDGDPYLEDPTVADLFAFLLESNEARRAVALDGDLRELIMRPVDTDAIHSEIRSLETEKQQLDDKLERLESLEQRLPDLESKKQNLEQKIEAKRDELDELTAEIEAADTSVTQSREGKNEFEETLDELKTARSELDDVRFRLDTERESLEELREEQTDLENQLEDHPESVEDSIQEIDAELSTLRERQRQLDNTLTELQTMLEFNEEMLEDASSEILAALREDSSDSNTTAELVRGNEQVACWTCGSTVQRSTIEDALMDLRNLRKEKAGERKSIAQQIDSLSEEKSALESQTSEWERIDRRLSKIKSEIQRREDSIQDLEASRTELLDTIDTLEELADELESDVQSEVLDRHREANELEFELDRLESDLDEVISEIQEIESKADEQQDLQTQREKIQSQLEELRTRIEDIEKTAVEEFNTHMDEVLDLLEYGNIERIWLERLERKVREGRQTVTRSTFELHVVRESDDGVTYDDSVTHLSESEREVTGLVFALAGYLVHNVYDDVPFILLDSLEGLDSVRLSNLIAYLEDYAEYLVVALLSEDAAELSPAYERVTSI